MRNALCTFAVSRGKLAVAEQVADSFGRSREKVDYLKSILSAHEKKHDEANAQRLKQKLAGVLSEARLGWDQKDPGREIIVNAWLDVADVSNQFLALRDLQTFLSGEKGNPQWAATGPARAASLLAHRLVTIHAMEKVYR